MTHFWDQICKHYNKIQLSSYVKTLAKSLEEWNDIKNDIVKFIGNFQAIQTFCKFRINVEDTICKALDLYKLKDLKCITLPSFIVDLCWKTCFIGLMCVMS